jgi:hypothetical protein
MSEKDQTILKQSKENSQPEKADTTANTAGQKPAAAPGLKAAGKKAGPRPATGAKKSTRRRRKKTAAGTTAASLQKNNVKTLVPQRPAESGIRVQDLNSGDAGPKKEKTRKEEQSRTEKAEPEAGLTVKGGKAEDKPQLQETAREAEAPVDTEKRNVEAPEIAEIQHSEPEAAQPAERTEEAEMPSATEEADTAETEKATTGAVEKTGATDEKQAEPVEREASEATLGKCAAEQEREAEEALADDDGPEELTPEERERIARVTKTVQVSLEAILKGVDEKTAAAEKGGTEAAEAGGEAAPVQPGGTQPDNTFEPNGTTTAQTLSTDVAEMKKFGKKIGHSLLGVAKWFALVLILVLVIAGVEIGWLYRNATPDMMPNIAVSFDGTALEQTAYAWHVPVVSNLIKRTYRQASKDAVTLAATVESAQPKLSVSPDDYDSKFVVKDSQNQEIFSGKLQDYTGFRFDKNGDYSAILTLTSQKTSFGNAVVTGSATYAFAFTVDVKPTVRLNTQAVTQGGLVSIRVTGELDDTEIPKLSSTLAKAAFVPASTGWVAYLPVDRTQEPGDYEITVSAGDYQNKLTLTVNAASWPYVDYRSDSQLVTPYIGVEDTPAEVQAALEGGDTEIYWKDSGFVQPFLSSVTIQMAYGTTEYVGRSREERAADAGTGRTCTNVVASCDSSDLISPASGRVLVAADLGGDAGNTLVIDHGAGLKSIFYGLKSLSVKKGDAVVKGQAVGKTGKTVIGEIRVGTVPVEPLSIWRGECDATKNY